MFHYFFDLVIYVFVVVLSSAGDGTVWSWGFNACIRV